MWGLRARVFLSWEGYGDIQAQKKKGNILHTPIMGTPNKIALRTKCCEVARERRCVFFFSCVLAFIVGFFMPFFLLFSFSLMIIFVGSCFWFLSYGGILCVFFFVFVCSVVWLLFVRVFMCCFFFPQSRMKFYSRSWWARVDQRVGHFSFDARIYRAFIGDWEKTGVFRTLSLKGCYSEILRRFRAGRWGRERQTLWRMILSDRSRSGEQVKIR